MTPTVAEWDEWTRPAIFGYTKAGRPLLIAFDVLDDDVPFRIYPITVDELEP